HLYSRARAACSDQSVAAAPTITARAIAAPAVRLYISIRTQSASSSYPPRKKARQNQIKYDVRFCPLAAIRLEPSGGICIVRSRGLRWPLGTNTGLKQRGFTQAPCTHLARVRVSSTKVCQEPTCVWLSRPIGTMRRI